MVISVTAEFTARSTMCNERMDILLVLSIWCESSDGRQKQSNTVQTLSHFKTLTTIFRTMI